MAFDLSTARPESGGGFDMSTAQPEQQPTQEVAQTRRGARTQRQPEPQRDPFEGLPENTIADIEARFPLPTDRVRGGGIGAINQRKRAAELEQVRMINPVLAEQIEETGGMEAFLVGAGRGLTTVGRGIGIAEDEAPVVTQAFEGLKTQQPGAAGGGELVGETAPFLAAGGPVSAVGKTALTRSLTQGGLGAAEGFILAKGKGANTEQALKTAAITGPLAGLASLAPVGSSGAGSRVDELADIDPPPLPTKKELVRTISEAAPSIDELKGASRQIFDEIDNLGVTLKPDAISGVSARLRSSLEDSGLDAVNTPKAFRAMRRLEDLVGEQPTLKQIDQIRETAQAAAGDTLNRKEAALGTQLINGIDEFLDDLQPGQFSGRAEGLGGKYKQARELWGRARRSELIEDAFIDAEDQASGFENGIRIAFRKILRSKKQRRFFSQDEISEMRKVVSGTKGANIAKLVGKLGISEGQATNFLGGSIGAFSGATVFGPAGAVIVPAIGQTSKQLAQRLTKGNADFANAVIRAGKDGKKITQAYLRSTPKAERDPQELAQLLMRPKVDMSNVVDIEIARQARDLAEEYRRQAAASVAAVSAPALAQEE